MFDDTDPEQTAYMGIADVPLIPLAHDKGVQGIFELKGANGVINGTIEVELRWQFTYMPPSALRSTKTREVWQPCCFSSEYDFKLGNVLKITQLQTLNSLNLTVNTKIGKYNFNHQTGHGTFQNWYILHITNTRKIDYRYWHCYLSCILNYMSQL